MAKQKSSSDESSDEEMKRSYHNALEQTRRQEITDSFIELQNNLNMPEGSCKQNLLDAFMDQSEQVKQTLISKFHAELARYLNGWKVLHGTLEREKQGEKICPNYIAKFYGELEAFKCTTDFGFVPNIGLEEAYKKYQEDVAQCTMEHHINMLKLSDKKTLPH